MNQDNSREEVYFKDGVHFTEGVPMLFMCDTEKHSRGIIRGLKNWFAGELLIVRCELWSSMGEHQWGFVNKEELRGKGIFFIMEEPERGTHPRLIKEVVALFCEALEKFNAYGVITSFSPQVLDAFSDNPENVYIVTSTTTDVVIENLQRDIIARHDEEFRKAGEEPIPYTDGLGDYWKMGFFCPRYWVDPSDGEHELQFFV